MDAIDTIKHAGYTIKFYQDFDPMDPRDSDNLGMMCHWHRRYDLGDRKANDTELEALRRGGFKLLNRYLRRYEGAVVVLPLGLLDHSGLTMWIGGGSHWSDSAGWDSGTVGFIYTTQKRIEELCGEFPYKPTEFEGTADEWIETQLEAEVKEYDQILTGDVYGYVIEDEDGEHVHSCWDFFGFKFCKQEAIKAADWERKNEIEQVEKISQCCAL